MERKGDYVGTYTGRKFYIIDPHPGDVCIEDISRSMVMTRRYIGHAAMPYSVLAHSWDLARTLKECGYDADLQLYAMLHDAHEAYLGDIAKPVKQYWPQYKEMADKIQSVIYKAFDITEPNEVQLAHLNRFHTQLYYNECAKLMPASEFWGNYEKAEMDIPLTSEKIGAERLEAKFLYEVTGLIHAHTFFKMCRKGVK